MGDNSFDSMLKKAALKEDMSLAFKAFDTYLSTKPDHLPLVATAGVLLLELNHISQPYLQNHYFYAVRADRC